MVPVQDITLVKTPRVKKISIRRNFMIDLKRSHSSETLGRDLALGTVVEQEGCLLVSKLEDNKEKAELKAVVDGSEKVIGFARTADSLPSRTVKVEKVVAAASVNLSESNLVSGQVKAEGFTVVTSGSPSAGEVKVNLATGALVFNSADFGSKVEFTYKYNLTVVAAKQMFGERAVNNRDLHAEFSKVEVGCGFVELYTDQFDASQDYSASGALKLGDNGLITKGGSGVELNLTVVHVPTAELPLLGVRGQFA